MTSTQQPVEIDLDLHVPIATADLYEVLNKLVAETPIAWNRAHGGYWVVAGYEEVREVYSDWERFSSTHDDVPGDPFADRTTGRETRSRRTGFSIPEAPSRFVPTEADPPLHTEVRALEAPFFTPKAVRGYEAEIRRHAVESLDAVAALGELDFAQFVASVSTKMACRLLGVDTASWADFAATVHAIGLTGFGSPDFPLERFRATQEKIFQLCAERKEDPRDDVASALMRGSILGQPVTALEAQTVLNGLTFGSTDTTNTTMLHILQYLAAHPELREQLRADLSLVPKAVEEFLRLFTPGVGAARTVTRDLDFHGFAFQEGQRVFMANSAANRDPRKFPNPLEFDMDRDNVKDHLAFGTGNHRCLGAPVARLEMRIMLEEILRRIPDFAIDPAKVVEYPTKTGVIGYDTVPAIFEPFDTTVPAEARPRP